MKNSIRTSIETDKLWPAYHAIQGSKPEAVKCHLNDFLTKQQHGKKVTYADLNNIIYSLENWLIPNDFIILSGSRPHYGSPQALIKTIRIVHIPSGQWFETDFYLPEDAQRGMARNSYGQRGALVNTLLMSQPEDDGETADGRGRNGEPSESRQKTQPSTDEKIPPTNQQTQSFENDKKCPECGKPMKLKSPKKNKDGKWGKVYVPFYGCTGWRPNNEGCDKTIDLTEPEMAEMAYSLAQDHGCDRQIVDEFITYFTDGKYNEMGMLSYPRLKDCITTWITGDFEGLDLWLAGTPPNKSHKNEIIAEIINIAAEISMPEENIMPWVNDYRHEDDKPLIENIFLQGKHTLYDLDVNQLKSVKLTLIKERDMK